MGFEDEGDDAYNMEDRLDEVEDGISDSNTALKPGNAPLPPVVIGVIRMVRIDWRNSVVFSPLMLGSLVLRFVPVAVDIVGAVCRTTTIERFSAKTF